MNTYEREPIGNIIIIKNLIFPNTVTNKKEIDHAWRNGRPCIIIHSDNDYDYILALKTNITDEKFGYHYFPLRKSNFLHQNISRYSNYNIKKRNNIETHGTINLQNIYKIPISGHDITAKITFETYKAIITKLKEYHQKENLNEIITNAQHIGGR